MTILNQMAALLTQARSKTLKRHGWPASNTQVVGSISCLVCGAPHLCPTLFPCVMQPEWGRVGMLKGCRLLPQAQPLGFSSVHRAS